MTVVALATIALETKDQGKLDFKLPSAKFPLDLSYKIMTRAALPPIVR